MFTEAESTLSGRVRFSELAEHLVGARLAFYKDPLLF